MPDAAAFGALCADLVAEEADLDALIAPLDDAAWDIATPAEGWALRDQISHLAFFEERGREALTEPDVFNAGLEAALADPRGSGVLIAEHLRAGRAMDPAALLAWWRRERAALLAALEDAPPDARVPWYGPPMNPMSFGTARLMETWAHGQDIADAVGTARRPTARLRHVAHLGVRTRGFSYMVRGLPAPDAPVRVELDAPDGSVWEWGPADAPDVVRGTALDFCLVVTQRRNRADVGLTVIGAAANEWMDIAQAFAGEPGKGRAPGQY
jgi:uncharacterized protein (TIGR03084 family)